MILGREISHGQLMTPINFEVTRSTVTSGFTSKTMSAQYIEKFMSDKHSTWQEDWSYTVDDPYTFCRPKVKVTVAFYAKTMSAQYLERFMSDSHCTWQEGRSQSVDEHMNAKVKLK